MTWPPNELIETPAVLCAQPAAESLHIQPDGSRETTKPKNDGENVTKSSFFEADQYPLNRSN